MKLTVIVLLGALFHPLADFLAGKGRQRRSKRSFPSQEGQKRAPQHPPLRGAVAFFHHRRSVPPVYEDTESEKTFGSFLDEPATLPASVVASAPLSALQANSSIQLDLFGHDIQQESSSHRLPLRAASMGRNRHSKAHIIGRNLRNFGPQLPGKEAPVKKVKE